MKGKSFHNILKYFNGEEHILEKPEKKMLQNLTLTQNAGKTQLCYVKNGCSKTIINVGEEKDTFLQCHIKDGKHNSKADTLHFLCKDYYWNEMICDFYYYFNACPDCNTHKKVLNNWMMVEVNIHGPFYEDSKNTECYVMSIIDLASNFCVLKTISPLLSLSEFASNLTNTFLTFGIPHIITFNKLIGMNLTDVTASFTKKMEEISKYYEKCDAVGNAIENNLPSVIVRQLNDVHLKDYDDLLKHCESFVSNNCHNVGSVTLFIENATNRNPYSHWCEQQLKDFVNQNPKTWTSIMPALMFKLNNSIASHNSVPPFSLMFNHPPCWKSKTVGNGNVDEEKNSEIVSQSKICEPKISDSTIGAINSSEHFVGANNKHDTSNDKDVSNNKTVEDGEMNGIAGNFGIAESNQDISEIHVNFFQDKLMQNVGGFNNDSDEGLNLNTDGKYEPPKIFLKSSLKCGSCSSTYVSCPEELEFHMKCHRDDERLMFCPFCDAKSLTWCHMLRHLSKHRKDEIETLSFLTDQSCKCDICDKIYTNQHSLKRHVQTVHEPVPHVQCKTCGKVFKEKKTYIRHLEKHEQQELKCDHCPYITQSSRSFKLHQRIHTDSSHQCKICSKTFPLPSILKMHLQTHDESKVRVTCEHCGLTFKTEVILRSHISRIHESSGVWPCSKCKYTGKTSSNLKSHFHRTHKKRYHCEECDYSTMISTALEKHKEMFHDVQNRPYGCNQCKYRSKDMKQLSEHVRLQHNPNILRYQCSKCNMKFKTLTLARDHMPTHTGERLYGCRICGYRAKHRQTVHVHVKSKHKDVSVQKALETPGPETMKMAKLMLIDTLKDSVADKSFHNQDTAKALSSIMDDQAMYEEYSEEVIVQSDQSVNTADEYVSIADLPESMASVDGSKVDNIVLQDGEKEVKMLEFTGSDGKLYAVQADDDRPISFVHNENGEITLQSFGLDHNNTLEIVEGEESTSSTSKTSEDQVPNIKSVELVILSMEDTKQ